MSEIINIDNKNIEVEQIRDNWALALMSQGVIVKLSISKWLAEARLTPEILGLKFSGEEGFDFSKKYLVLGKQKLLPVEIIKEISTVEQRARNTLLNYSFDTVWGKFIPFTAFSEWEKENEIIRNDFINQAVALGNRYDEIICLVKEEYRKMAKDVWIRLYPASNTEPAISFTEDFVNKVISKIPAKEDIVASFRYNTTISIIPMPSFIADNIEKAEQIRRQGEMAQFESDLEKKTKIKIKEEYIKRKKELIDGFLESTVLSMRRYISELCSDVLLFMGSNKNKLNYLNIKKLKAMIKKVGFLNFYNDKETSDLIKDLGNELDKLHSEIDNGMIVDKLREIVDFSKKEYVPKNFNPLIGSLEI